MDEEHVQHFSHEHPLSFFPMGDDYEDEMGYLCSICGLPILSSPSYTCSIDANCNFFLHKPCAHLPEKFFHDGHLDTLTLEPPPPAEVDAVGTSESCRQNYFTYKCPNYIKCKFHLHPLVAKPVEIRSKHKSHKPHPLVAFCREIVSRCDGCEAEQKGFFFYCGECNFWIHQDCAVLPSLVKLPSHPHPFILTYSVPYALYSPCVICERRPGADFHTGVYFCGECICMVHVGCAISRMENRTFEARLELIQLPDEGDTFPSLVIRSYIERNPLSQHDHGDKKYHDHPLILEDGSVNSSTSAGEASRNLVCDVCIQPINISSPFYRCQLQSSEDCHFLAHDICANHLPNSEEFFFAANSFKTVLCSESEMSKGFRNSVFRCFCCHRPCNGFSYVIVAEGRMLTACLDAECMFAPRMIKHASHRQHVLFQTTRVGQWDNSIPLSCCSGESLFFDVYKCVLCDFYIHIRCASLPRKTRHKFDEHPVELIMTAPRNYMSSNGEQERFSLFCEFCEQDIEQQYWYYGCAECEHYFHINCIPSVGHFSKVKFGKTLVGKNVHPDHPLALTRMLTHGRHERCGVCNQIIEGSVDEEMAFHCSECDFWIHFSCAWDPSSSSSSGLKVYSQVAKEDEQMIRAVYSLMARLMLYQLGLQDQDIPAQP